MTSADSAGSARNRYTKSAVAAFSSEATRNSFAATGGNAGMFVFLDIHRHLTPVTIRLIRDAGWIPAQRDQYYHVLRRHDGPDSPDLVADANPPMRNVKKVDATHIGAAPGIGLASDMQILGDE